MTPQYISALETGRKNATIETLEKIATGLRVDLFSLFCFDSSSEKPSKQSLKKLIDDVPSDEVARVAKILALMMS